MTKTIVPVNTEEFKCTMDITPIGDVFQAKMEMIAFNTLFHVATSQAKTEEELRNDFEYFKSGFTKLLKLIIADKSEGFTPKEERITWKEARVMKGIHPYILAERMGITLEYLKRLEEGTAKRGLNVDQAYIHFQSTYNRGMMIDWIDWS